MITCPRCSHHSMILDTKSRADNVIARDRRCVNCGLEFVTLEVHSVVATASMLRRHADSVTARVARWNREIRFALLMAKVGSYNALAAVSDEKYCDAYRMANNGKRNLKIVQEFKEKFDCK